MLGMKIGIAVLTFNAKKDLPFCLPPLLKYKVLVVDSSSTDGTAELAKEMGAEVVSIPKKSFHHGLTREFARQLLETDIVVMVTQDAYAQDEAVEKLVKPLLEGQASLAYARQLPKSQDPFEAFPRRFNYPGESHIRSLKDAKKFGSFLFFFSNSFGAYLNSALEGIGGFPKVPFGEDTHACAKLLKKGHRVAYVAESLVYHSHNYSAAREFKRHFEIGLTRGDLLSHGKDEIRGKAYALSFLHSLNYRLLPKGVIHLFAKYAGYKIGRSARLLGIK